MFSGLAYPSPRQGKKEIIVFGFIIEYSSSFRDFCPLGKIKIIGLFLLCGVLKR